MSHVHIRGAVHTSNQDSRKYVNSKTPFNASNMFAINIGGTERDYTGINWNNIKRISGNNFYVVYSYGYHFPMYIYDYRLKRWFGNSDKYSKSTSRHQSWARPSTDIIIWLDTNGMLGVLDGKPKRLADWGTGKKRNLWDYMNKFQDAYYY